MALNIHPANEPMVVSRVVALIYGQSGIGKTTLGFSAKNPVLLDFDRGAHRSEFRGDVVPIGEWPDVARITAEDVSQYSTVVVDTVGRCLDSISAHLIASDPKNARKDGSLSLQGFGALKNVFSSWMRRLQSFGVDIVLLAHDKEERGDGDEIYVRPDAQGGSYLEIFKVADSVAYYHVQNQSRVLEFSPAERWVGKDPGRFGSVVVPDFADAGPFLGNLLNNLKQKLSSGSSASTAAQSSVDNYREDIEATTDVDDLLNIWKCTEEEPRAVRAQIWEVITRRARKLGYVWSKADNDFVEE